MGCVPSSSTEKSSHRSVKQEIIQQQVCPAGAYGKGETSFNIISSTSGEGQSLAAWTPAKLKATEVKAGADVCSFNTTSFGGDDPTTQRLLAEPWVKYWVPRFSDNSLTALRRELSNSSSGSGGTRSEKRLRRSYRVGLRARDGLVIAALLQHYHCAEIAKEQRSSSSVFRGDEEDLHSSFSSTSSAPPPAIPVSLVIAFFKKLALLQQASVDGKNTFGQDSSYYIKGTGGTPTDWLDPVVGMVAPTPRRMPASSSSSTISGLYQWLLTANDESGQSSLGERKNAEDQVLMHLARLIRHDQKEIVCTIVGNLGSFSAVPVGRMAFGSKFCGRPFYLACAAANLPVVTAFLEADMKPEDVEGPEAVDGHVTSPELPLVGAAGSSAGKVEDRVAVLRLLFQAGITAGLHQPPPPAAAGTMPDPHHALALHAAAAANQVEVIELLLDGVEGKDKEHQQKDQGEKNTGAKKNQETTFFAADLEETDHLGRNALHHAAAGGSLEAVQVLLARMPKVDRQISEEFVEDESNPPEAAALAAVMVLVKDRTGRTPLQSAAGFPLIENLIREEIKQLKKS